MAQSVDLRLDSIASRASEKNEITLDGAMLANVLKKTKGEGLTKVALRNYEFKKTGEYTSADLDSLRLQLTQSAGWKRVIDIKEREERVEVYAFEQGGPNSQLLIISMEPRELTVVHTVGAFNLANIGNFVDDLVGYVLRAGK